MKQPYYRSGCDSRAIRGMAVGIMPLKDSLSERGKCSFKMLNYIACGAPVMVSSVGMNVEVLTQGNIGFGDQTDEAPSLVAGVRDVLACKLTETRTTRGIDYVKSNFSWSSYPNADRRRMSINCVGAFE